MRPIYFFILKLLLAITPLAGGASATRPACLPLKSDSILIPHCTFSVVNEKDTFCIFSIRLADHFNGRLAINTDKISVSTPIVTVWDSDSVYEMSAMMERDSRSCVFVGRSPIKKSESLQISIPASLLEVQPEYVEVDEIDIEEEDLENLSVAGAWHKPGSKWVSPGMFSVIDDDSLDGQIESSKHARFTYGYYSLLYPLLESMGIKGNLAIEGRKIGIDELTPNFNDNGKTLVRLQDEKGWNLLCHSMDCLGETLNNWAVDSLDSPLAHEIFKKGPNNGLSAFTVSVFDMQTRKQYWPNADNTGWELTPERFIKPYAGNYSSGREILYNEDFSIDWHWGEWKRRAASYGIKAVGFVTHNSTSSHALIPGIMEFFPFGLSDIASLNINTVPLLSSGVRAGLEGQSLGGYDGNSTDNHYKKNHYKKFCELIDEAAGKGGWIIFNLHTYRDCWLNRLPGKLVSEGGSYPDEWVIPMKGMDSATDPLDPPQHLGISDWSEWHPCPGTRLEMMRDILEYAKKKGLQSVTISEGLSKMGNKKSKGYFNRGYRFGMDLPPGLTDTKDIYPHYVVSATDEVFYYSPLISQEISMRLQDFKSIESIHADKSGEFLFGNGFIYWSSPNPSDITLKVFDISGKEIMSVSDNRINISTASHGTYVVCALAGGSVISSVKVAH